jgi:hypothetical protein
MHLPGCRIVFSAGYGILEKESSRHREKGVFSMTARIDEKEAEKIEELAGEAEIILEENDDKKDLKEKRGILKQTLYEGSKKLKHILPKGKHL